MCASPTALVHVAPIAITVGTLTLTFQQTVLGQARRRDTNTILNLLQFAAQFHGSLIVMSLSAIVLHVVSSGLRSSGGIPHGFLTSSFQLNSLSYLLRSEFWGAWKQKRTADFRYIGFFLSMFLLAFACQPSSAIAMIPRLQFWPLSDIYPSQRHTIQSVHSSEPGDTLPPNPGCRYCTIELFAGECIS